MSPAASLVLGVDGGNSKADVALADSDGGLRALVHGPTISHQVVGMEEGTARLSELAGRAARQAGLGARDKSRVELGVYSIAGADFPSDERLLEREIALLGLARRTVVLNDTFGALRAGTDRPWGVALVCGQGINASGIAPDGRIVRFPGVGEISGDWGGGGGVAMAGLGAAIRGSDGRGPRTSLERLVPAHFGLKRPYVLVEALYTERVPQSRIPELAPLVFRAAGEGDAVARSIVDRLADELVDWACAVIRRLRLARLDPDVVLAGGVFQTEEPGFYARLGQGIHAVAPGARLVRLSQPPVLGALLLALDRLAAPSPGGGGTQPAVAARLRKGFARWRAEGSAGP